MANDTSGQPGSAPAETTTVTPPVDTAQPAPTVLSKTTDDFSQRLARAGNPLEVQRLLDEVRKPAPPSEKPAVSDSGKPKEAQSGDGNTPAEADGKKQEGETQPADATEKPAEETAKPEEEESDPGEGDNDLPVTPLTAKRAHLRLPPESDQVGRLALGYLRRNRDWSLEQAIEAAQKQLGVEKPASADEPASKSEPGTAAKPTSGFPETVEATDAEIERLEDEKAKATTDLRFEDSAKLERQLRKLDRHRLDLVRQFEKVAIEQQAAREARYNVEFDKSASRAGELYDFAADPASEGGKRMLEIEETLRQTGDPLFNSPNKPLVIAQMVARELRIAPKTKAAVKPAAKTAPAAPTAKPKSVIAEGGATTTPATKDSQGKFAESVNSVHTLGDLKKLAAGLGIPI